MKINDDIYVFWILKNNKTGTFDVWVHNEEIGVAMFCFGVSVDDFTMIQVKNMIHDNCFMYIDTYNMNIFTGL